MSRLKRYSLRLGGSPGGLFLLAFFSSFCISPRSSTGAPRESGQEGRPFQWTTELRRGGRFDNPEIPFTFVAPTDLVFRVLHESNEPRLEARSYREESFFLSITGLKNLRARTLSELRPLLTGECNGKLQPITETPDSLRVRCMEAETPGRPGLILLLILEHMQGIPADPGSNRRASPERYFLISVAVTSENESYLSDLMLARR